ncbi:MAG: TonB-dependent receptor plug domain-containing protein [Paludibacteraceae bacterium]|nr:TonB-dependent receptor plug domain-containing protein [Paludibacteraceae bacterium]
MLLIFVFLFLLPLCVQADDFKLDEIEVTASRVQSSTEPYRVVAHIPHEEIAVLPVSNIADILAYLPNLDVRSRGASEAQSDVSMRGGTADQVLILLNGIPLMEAQTGHYAMNIPIPPALIERIEILQNASSTTSGALTGAINIVTKGERLKVNGEREFQLQLSAGTNSDVTPSFIGSWTCKEAQFNTAVEYARSNGYYAPKPNAKESEALQNTDYQLANVYFQSRWQGLDVQAGAQFKNAGLGTGYGYASTDQFDATRTAFVSARYVHAFSDAWTLTSQAAYRGQFDRYEWHMNTPTNRHWTHNAHASLQAQYTSSIGRTTFGATMQNEFIHSTNMGEHNRWQASLHAGQHFYRQGFTASLGLAGHYNSWHGWYGSGDAHLGYSFLTTGYVGVTASRSLRMPTWTDLYYKAGVQRGSTSLKAEKAWQLALNAHYTWSWRNAGQLSITADIYHRWGQDIIDWNYNETDSLFYATNQNRVNTFGVEGGAEYRFHPWLRSVRLSYAYTNLSLDLTKAKSNYLDYLRHKLTFQLNHGIYVWSRGTLGALWSLRWQQREGTYVDIYGTSGHPFQPVILLDGSVYLEMKHVRISFDCTNMTNCYYYDYGGILMPGAHGRITITATGICK